MTATTATDRELYRVLKVRKNASAESIKSAYRKAAMDSHPDRGGDQEQFELVKLAYAVLSDPGRRAAYDETGRVDAPKPDNQMSEIMSILAPCLMGVVQQALQSGKKLQHVDIVARMRQKIQDQLAEKRTAEKNMQRGHEMLSATAERFEVDNGQTNYLREIMEGKAAELLNQLKQCRQEITIMEKALEFLKNFKYRADRPPEMDPGLTAATAYFDVRFTTNA